MPEIRSLTRQVPVETLIELGSEDTIRLTFDRNAITPYLLSQMSQRLEGGDVMAVATMLEKVILAWDVTEDGNPFPPTAQNIGRLSVSALGSLSQRIGEAAVPSDAEGNASSDTSSTQEQASTQQQASLQNGPESSQSPAPSASPSPT
jgi:hypothetical protein